MSRRNSAILMLVLITLQVMLGGGRGISAICLGGGHQHEAQATSEPALPCDHACAHEPFRPVTDPIDRHDDGCECLDVRLTSVDLATNSREVDLADAAEVDDIPAVTIESLGIADAIDAGAAVTGPPRPPRLLHAAAAHRAAVISTTRLLI